jgi:hypothetical protein
LKNSIHGTHSDCAFFANTHVGFFSLTLKDDKVL